MTTIQDRIIKKFDEIFYFDIDAQEWDCVKYNPNSGSIMDDVKDFIKTTIKEVQKETRKEMIDKLENLKEKRIMVDSGWFMIDIEEIEKLILSITNKDNNCQCDDCQKINHLPSNKEFEL